MKHGKEMPNLKMNSTKLAWISKVLVIVFIILFGFLSFSIKPTGQAQYANIHCCLTTCQETLPSECPGEIRAGSFCKDLPECHVGCCIDKEGYCYDNYLRESCTTRGTFFAGGCINSLQCVTKKPLGDPAGNIGIPVLYSQEALVFVEPMAASIGTPVTIKVISLQRSNATLLEAIIKDGHNYSSSVALFDDGWHGDGNAHDQLFAGVWRGENLSAFQGHKVLKVIAPGGWESQLILSSTRCLPLVPGLEQRQKAVIFTSKEREGNVNTFFTRARVIAEMMLRISGEQGPNASNLFPHNEYNYFFFERGFAEDSVSELQEAVKECFVNQSMMIHLSSDVEVCRREGEVFRVNSSFLLLPNETITSQEEFLQNFCERVTTEDEMRRLFLERKISPSVNIPFVSLGESNHSHTEIEFIITDNQQEELNYSIFYDLDHPLTTLVEGIAFPNETIRRIVSVPDGEHNLIIKATDNDRNYGFSDPVSIDKNVHHFIIEITSLEKIVHPTAPDINFTIYHDTELELAYGLVVDEFIYPGTALTNTPIIVKPELALGEHVVHITSTDGKANATSLPYYIIIGDEEEPTLIPAYPTE